jgi:hypothetical protein
MMMGMVADSRAAAGAKLSIHEKAQHRPVRQPAGHHHWWITLQEGQSVIDANVAGTSLLCA